MLDTNFLIGGDPEFFCIDTETNKYISLIPFIKGVKGKPEKIDVKGCSQLRDNVAIELNLPPVPEFWMLHKIIDDCIVYTNKWIAKELDDIFRLEITSSAIFDKEHLNHPEAMEFGCEPAYSIYRGNKSVPRPEPKSIGGLRTASYHLHYGWNHFISKEELRDFIFLNDLFLGLPAMFLDKTNALRVNVYGELGEHRIKHDKYDPEGLPVEYSDIKLSKRVEYRSLGAGIHLFPGFIENGIKLIKKAIEENQIEELKELYFQDFTEIFCNLTDIESLIKLKNKLIKNGHYNR